MNRRELSRSLVGAIASHCLLQTLFLKDAFAGTVRPVTDHWIRGLHEMGRDLRTGRITPGQWQAKVDELFNRVGFEELLARIDFDKLTRGLELPELGVNTKWVSFPQLEGLPERLAFAGKIFGMKKNRAIIPHGHKNMVSCHYVLKGEFWLRHYDRIEDDATHMVIEPTVDQLARVGSHSAISDEKNNVHWLKALTDTAFTYDVLIADLNGRDYEVDNIDPYAAEKITGNRLRVRKISVEEGLTRYGHDTHHIGI